MTDEPGLRYLHQHDYHHDELPRTRTSQPGWHNLRCASRLDVEDTDTEYIITTTLHGILPDSLTITLYDEFLIMEGQLATSTQSQIRYGRYVRHVPLEYPVNPAFMDSRYFMDGTLIIHLRKHNT